MKPALPVKAIDMDALTAFLEDFHKESDRAVAIVGAAKCDLLLFQLLQRALLPCTGNRDELLEGDSPLGSFSARIQLAHRLGLIDDQYARALHILRRLRNGFAHEPASSALTAASHRDRVRELVAPFAPYKQFDSHLKLIKEVSDPRRDFLGALEVMIGRLDQLVASVEQVSPRLMQPLIPPHWERT